MASKKTGRKRPSPPKSAPAPLQEQTPAVLSMTSQTAAKLDPLLQLMAVRAPRAGESLRAWAAAF